MASRTSRIEVLRGRPPGYTGIRGSTKAHCSSVRSLGYCWVRIPHSTGLDPPYRTDSNTITITGTNLAGTTQLLFGSTPADSFTVDSNTQITAIVPAALSG